MLTSKYLNGIPSDSRAAQGKSLSTDVLTEEALAGIRALNALADGRGQTLAQMALAWALRDPRMTSLVIGASSPEQVRDSAGALARLDFTEDELATIDRHATATGIDLWKTARRSSGMRI